MAKILTVSRKSHNLIETLLRKKRRDVGIVFTFSECFADHRLILVRVEINWNFHARNSTIVWILSRAPIQLKNSLPFCTIVFGQFVIEAQVGNGLEGDIALDDLSVIDGSCTHISNQGKMNK